MEYLERKVLGYWEKMNIVVMWNEDEVGEK